MQKKLLGIMIGFVVSLAALSTPATAAVEVTGDAYAGINSMYLWRGFDLSNSDPVAQGGMDMSFNGLTFSYWSNLDFNSGELNETDITIDYSMKLGENLSLSAGNIFYALDGAPDTNELYLGLSLGALLSPTVTIYYDYDKAEETGLFYTLSVSHELSISDELGLSFGGLVSYNSRSDYAVGDYSALHNYELNFGASYALSDQLSLDGFLTYSDALSDSAEEVIEDQFVGGTSLTISF